MLRLLMQQNKILAEFIRHQLDCRGNFEYVLCSKLKGQEWGLRHDLKRSCIHHREDINEFLIQLKFEGIKYEIKRGGPSYLDEEWDGYKIIVPAE